MTNIEAILTNYDRIFKGTTMWKEQRSFLKQSLTSFEKEIREAEQIRIEIELDGAYPKDGNIPKRDIATALEEQKQDIAQMIGDANGTGDRAHCLVVEKLRLRLLNGKE